MKNEKLVDEWEQKAKEWEQKAKEWEQLAKDFKPSEKWIGEKARELCEQNYVNDEAKDFIRNLFKEAKEKQNARKR